MCPPGVDQTMRSSQSWRIIAPELLEYTDVDTSEGKWPWRSDLCAKLLNPEIQWDTWGKLARPVISAPPHLGSPLLCSGKIMTKGHRGRAVKFCRIVMETRQTSTVSTLEGLSTELLYMILERMKGGDNSKSDAIALGFCSQRLWQIVVNHVHSGYLKCAASWAGKKIAFQGSYSMDLPPPFEADGLVTQAIVAPTTGRWRMCAARRFLWRHEESPVTPYTEEMEWLKAARDHHSKDKALASVSLSSIEDHLECSYLYPDTERWLLRNLTTHEMVSSEKLPCLVANHFGKIYRGLTFQEVLLMRICWTSILSGEDTHLEKLNTKRGVWAGHCFDIVTAKAHEAEKQSDPWRDVTEEVANEAQVLREHLREEECDSEQED